MKVIKTIGTILAFLAIGISLFRLFHDVQFSLASVVVFGSLFFIVAELLRVLRLRIIMSGGRIGNLVLVNSSLFGDLIGGLLNKFIGEFVKILLIRSFSAERFVKIAIAIIYSRIHDLVFLILILLVLSDRTRSSGHVFIAVVIIGGLVLMSLMFLMPKICDRLLSHLMKHHPRKYSIGMMKFLTDVKHYYLEMKITRPEAILVTFLITAAIWFSETFALIVVTQNLSIFTSSAIPDLFEKIVKNISAVILSGTHINMYLLFFFSVFIFVMILNLMNVVLKFGRKCYEIYYLK